MTCPACGEPLRPDYGEDVEPVIGRAQVYTAHTGRCAGELRAALAELGELAATSGRPVTPASTSERRR